MGAESPGNRLRIIREKLGYKLRDVQSRSEVLEKKYGNEEYSVLPGRLSDIETKDAAPSIYKLYSLSVIYRLDLQEILRWYGVDLAQVTEDVAALPAPSRTHQSSVAAAIDMVRLPTSLDPGFDPRRTTNIGRMVEKWGAIPFANLQALASKDHTYGYIGTEDFTMYPLLMPGTFLQVDESKAAVANGVWRSEYERPIYFLETRDGFLCSWCALNGDTIVLQPHPLSPVPVRFMKHPQEAEVVGQVVGIAMKLDGFSPPTHSTDTKVQSKLN